MSKILVADDEMIERTGTLGTGEARRIDPGYRDARDHRPFGGRDDPEKRPASADHFLTAFDEFDYARKAITVHALDYILKPYDQGELFSVVDEALDMAEFARSSRDSMKAAEEIRKTAEGPEETGKDTEGPEEVRKAAGSPEKPPERQLPLP